MRLTALYLIALLSGASAAVQDTTAHTVRFVDVQPDVKIEVLDFGGPSTPGTPTLVLLSGLGDTAHAFDAFATTLSKTYRVFGLTRRGFGASSSPSTGYGADRLGDDVLAVIDALKLMKPILVGHSLGGEELSSIGSRHPGRVAGLIYLDAGYGYAYAAPGQEPMKPPPPGTAPPIIEAIMSGTQRYTVIPVPILAIYAVPRRMPASVSDADRQASAERDKMVFAQADAFERGLPSARVIHMPNAGHYVHRTNAADVLREMDAFIAALRP
jgi:non-heme chloroperoxidase